MPDLEIQVERLPGGRALVTLRGSIDAHTLKNLGPVLTDLIKARHCHLVVDLRGLEYVSSSGMMLLLMTRDDARKAGGDTILVRPRPQIFQLFRMIGLHESLAFAATVEEAWAAHR